MDEKYCLKWNDFQETVAGSLSLLKKEEDFFDVTLVSEDQTQIKAHKVVLSACMQSLLQKYSEEQSSSTSIIVFRWHQFK